MLALSIDSAQDVTIPAGDLTVTGTIQVNNAAGGAILDESASSTNPTLVPDRADPGTGIGADGSSDLYFTTGGNQVGHFNATGDLLVTGSLTVAGSIAIQGGNADGPALMNEAASATNPTFIPDKNSGTDTGIGSSGTAVINLITGGTEAVEIDASQNVDIKAGNLDVTGGTVKESGTDISPIGKHMTPVVAGDMLSRTTSGAQAASIETSTNKVMVDFLAFDTSADEFAQFILPMPKSWNESTVTYVARWTHPSTATNFGVTFCLQGIAFGNSDALDAAFGTAVCVDDTGGTTDDLFVSPESTAITVGGTPAESDSVTFQLYRDVSDANDDLAVDARITAIDLYITSNAATDD